MPAALPVRQWVEHIAAVRPGKQSPVSRGIATTPLGVFPQVRAVPQAQAHVARTRVIGKRHFSCIDGLPLPTPTSYEHSPSSCSNVLRPRSRSPHRLAEGTAPDVSLRAGNSSSSSGASAGVEVAGGRRPAFFFIDVLAHRTLARCAACDQPLAGDGRGCTAERSCVLGFYAQSPFRRESHIRWAHAVAECLGQLGLPAIAPGDMSDGVVFSPDVSNAAKAAVLASLTAAMADAGGSQRLHLERWWYASAARRWLQPFAGQGGGAVLGHLQDVLLQAEDLRRMCGDDRTAPMCVICMEDFAEHDEAVRLPCAHLFHKYCAAEWLRRRPVCPLDLVPVQGEPATTSHTRAR